MIDGADSPHLAEAVRLDRKITEMRDQLTALVERRDREIYLARTVDGVWPRHIAAQLGSIAHDSVKGVISGQRRAARRAAASGGERSPDTPTGEHLPGVSGEREHDQTE